MICKMILETSFSYALSCKRNTSFESNLFTNQFFFPWMKTLWIRQAKREGHMTDRTPRIDRTVIAKQCPDHDLQNDSRNLILVCFQLQEKYFILSQISLQIVLFLLNENPLTSTARRAYDRPHAQNRYCDCKTMSRQ